MIHGSKYNITENFKFYKMNSKENTTEKVSENVLEGNLHSYVYT
jgi:hypothetical protein